MKLYNIFYSPHPPSSDVVGDGVVVVRGDRVVGAGARVAHALALEIHVVIQVMSRRGLCLVIIVIMTSDNDDNDHLMMLVIRLEGGEDVRDTAPAPA